MTQRITLGSLSNLREDRPFLRPGLLTLKPILQAVIDEKSSLEHAHYHHHPKSLTTKKRQKNDETTAEKRKEQKSASVVLPYMSALTRGAQNN